MVAVVSYVQRFSEQVCECHDHRSLWPARFSNSWTRQYPEERSTK